MEKRENFRKRVKRSKVPKITLRLWPVPESDREEGQQEATCLHVPTRKGGQATWARFHHWITGLKKALRISMVFLSCVHLREETILREVRFVVNLTGFKNRLRDTLGLVCEV